MCLGNGNAVISFPSPFLKKKNKTRKMKIELAFLEEILLFRLDLFHGHNPFSLYIPLRCFNELIYTLSDKCLPTVNIAKD